MAKKELEGCSCSALVKDQELLRCCYLRVIKLMMELDFCYVMGSCSKLSKEPNKD